MVVTNINSAYLSTVFEGLLVLSIRIFCHYSSDPSKSIIIYFLLFYHLFIVIIFKLYIAMYVSDACGCLAPINVI